MANLKQMHTQCKRRDVMQWDVKYARLLMSYATRDFISIIHSQRVKHSSKRVE